MANIDVSFFDGEHTYRDYFSTHTDESVDWCKCYMADGRNAVCVNDITTNEISAIMIGGKDIDFRDDVGAIHRLAKAVNSDYSLYHGWSDAHIAIEAMKEVGCTSCPWFSVCDQMDEKMQ